MTSLETFNNCSLISIDWAGRSAVDRLLCKQEGSGPNPDRSTQLLCKLHKADLFIFIYKFIGNIQLMKILNSCLY